MPDIANSLAKEAVEQSNLSAEGKAVADIITRAQADPAFANTPEVKAILDKVNASKPAVPTVQAPPVASGSPALSEEGKNIAQVIDMAKADPTFAALPEVKAILDAATAQKAAEEKSKLPDAPAEEAAADETTDDDIDETDEGLMDPATGKKAKSVFYSGKVKTPVLKTAEEHAKYIKDKFGVTDPVQLYTAAEKWREDSNSLKEAAEQNSGYQKLFDELPDPIMDQIQTWGKGGNWMEVAKTSLPTFDFSKSFDSQKEQVVNHYFPGKFKSEEINDKADMVAQGAVDVAKAKFDNEKQGLENKRALTLEDADKRGKALKASVDGSVSALRERFPDFNPRHLADVRQMMLSGDMNPMFFKKDGTAKPEGAIRAAMALYGEQEVTGKVNTETRKAAKNASNEARMELLSRGKTTVTSPSAGETREVVPASVASVLKGVNKKSTY